MYMQARYYDPVIGRFYSNDPIGFTNIHTFNRYAYANNNPYRYTDPDGRKAGDLFKTQTLAAMDFGKTYNDDSIRNNKEYGSTIFSITTQGNFSPKVTLFSYNVPRQGDSESVEINSKLGKGQKAILEIHSHSSGGGYENPSDSDIKNLSEGGNWINHNTQWQIS
jgi:uncharacterized protein RhaS with RHS repeats